MPGMAAFPNLAREFSFFIIILSGLTGPVKKPAPLGTLSQLPAYNFIILLDEAR